MTHHVFLCLAYLLCTIDLLAQPTNYLADVTVSEATMQDLVHLTSTNGLPAAPSAVFTENRGQWNQQARFRMDHNDMTLWITDRGAVYDLHRVEQSDDPTVTFIAMTGGPLAQPARSLSYSLRRHVVSMTFEGISGRSRATGVGDIGRRTNYLIGREQHWGTDCRSYSRITLEQVYDGIDAILRLENGVPSYELHVSPGTDPSQIRFRLDGSEGLCISTGGELLVATSLGETRMKTVFAYQQTNGGRRKVDCRFRLETDGSIGFSLGRHDPHRALVIGPLVYSTLIGGEVNDEGHAVLPDGNGSVWIAGFTGQGSTTYPTESGAYDTTQNGSYDVFISKIDPAATGAAQLAYSTFIGGSSHDIATALDIDEEGKLWVSGYTGGGIPPYPTTPGAYSVEPGGGNDVFVTKIDPTAAGSAQLAYSTLIGGSFHENSQALALDRNGKVWITGSTRSNAPGYPTTPGSFDRSYNGGYDLIVTQIDPSAAGDAQLAYSTLIGGSGDEFGLALTIDGNDKIWITGSTSSGTSPYPTTADAFDGAGHGDRDVFVTQLDPTTDSGAQLAYSTLIGGKGEDWGTALVLDDSGGIWISGGTYTDSEDPVFPTTSGVFDETGNGSDDIFLTRLDLSKTGAEQLAYSTFIGGGGEDQCQALVLDASGKIWIAGYTGSGSPPYPTTSGAFDESFNSPDGFYDAFLTQLDPSAVGADQLAYSTFIGGVYDDRAYALALDGSGKVWITGYAGGPPTYPTTADAYDVTFNGNYDVFVTLLDPSKTSSTPSNQGTDDKAVILRLSLR